MQVQETNPIVAKADRRFLTGIDCLVEAIFKVREMDEAAGRRTGGFISGYPGSPLGTLDLALAKVTKRLADGDIVFKPGLNEDLAATACWGTQQVGLMPKPERDGVFAFWYGKGPGVDRSVDAIKHGNMAGTTAQGGVVLLFGDDHLCKSSSITHQSEPSLAAAGVPVFNPSTIQEYIDYIPLAVTLSRYAGVWVGVKLVTETVESAQLVDLRLSGIADIALAGSPEHKISTEFRPLAVEQSLYERRLPAVHRFAAAAGIDKTVWDPSDRRLGIVAPGKAMVDTMEALRLLGIDEAKAARMGIGIFKPLLTWPLEPTAISAFARGYGEVLVIEEKRPLVEEQFARFILRLPLDQRPMLSGKSAPDGETLLIDYGELTPESVAEAIAKRLVAIGIADTKVEEWLKRRHSSKTVAGLIAPFARPPMFCSGCPHNRSTKLPEGSMAFGGIGCHAMAAWIPGRETLIGTHMGAEGANWIGIDPFSGVDHIFQNMGDGTFAHSGFLAIRSAIAAGSTITYKLLFNSAVAMTGGQAIQGTRGPLDVARELLAEGVARVALVTEDVSRYPSVPQDISLHPRDELDAVQKNMRTVKGVSAIIYDQGCAAERRRLRKKKQWPDPDLRTFINSDVCEGCGDCSAKSNCVSILPQPTELGVKRVIDQDSCNKDYSCTEGFCPSFVTVKGGKLRRSAMDMSLADRILAELPPIEPKSAADVFNLVLVGIGGTGIITLGNLVGKAAERQGLSALTFDVTGLAQKNGAVFSHVRLMRGGDVGLYRPRIPSGQLDLLVGCDIVASCGPEILSLFDSGRTEAIVSDLVTPTATFQTTPDHEPRTTEFRSILEQSAAHCSLVPATAALSQIPAGPLLNLYVLGFAVQRGLIPILPEHFEAVMTGGDIERNRLSFRLGRLAAQSPDRIAALLDPKSTVSLITERSFDEAVRRYTELLAAFNGSEYAEDYARYVTAVRANDPEEAFSRSVANGLFRVMYYKDEYEVARLHISPEFKARLAAQFEGDYTLEYKLAPPVLSRAGKSGEPRKRTFGPWVEKLFHVLARARFLRGTAFDPFGYTRDRQLERALIGEYKGWIDDLIPRLTSIDYATAVTIAELPMAMRGYGHVKHRNVEAARTARMALVAKLVPARDRNPQEDQTPSTVSLTEDRTA